MNPDWQYQLRDEIREVVGDNQIDTNICLLDYNSFGLDYLFTMAFLMTQMSALGPQGMR
ncbi:unnamed protein product [Prunus armeniaca]|uniref:Uncharacterized protein n=1 Tax=Prunus armeniaca TaxID=36596 RepID=A0A6J5WJY3_PRUAR|nr:unnamed protein product [Prunus armeniaca]